MQPDDHVCLCFHVSLRKLRAFMHQRRPGVPSQLSECFGAGTGCHWCVPFLTKLHEQWRQGQAPDLPIAPEEYARRRVRYRRTGVRTDEALSDRDPGGGSEVVATPDRLTPPPEGP